MNNNEKILLVDDEPRVIEALQRSLRTEFNLQIAEGPENGLQALAQNGPFAVVVSDLRMPGMDGVQFLARVKASSPDTIRVMLTGQADMDDAIAAINEGNIFRFLTKPCPAATLGRILEAALEQYRLVTAERQLLHSTLMGSVTVLTEILSVLHPAVFGRSFRIRRYVTLLAKHLKMQDVWQFEVAAILSQIGCITLPLATVDQYYAGVPLSEEETRLFARHPSAGAAFLRPIPRLESTAHIIAWQQKAYRDYQAEPDGIGGHIVTLGAQMLRVAIELEHLLGCGCTFRHALADMRSQAGEYNPDLLQILEDAGEPMILRKPAIVGISELDTTMVANEDIRARNGLLLLAKGEQFTQPTLERLLSFASELGVVEPIQVLLAQAVQEHYATLSPVAV